MDTASKGEKNPFIEEEGQAGLSVPSGTEEQFDIDLTNTLVFERQDDAAKVFRTMKCVNGNETDPRWSRVVYRKTYRVCHESKDALEEIEKMMADGDDPDDLGGITFDKFYE